MPALNMQQRDEINAICGLRSARIDLPSLSINGLNILNVDTCRDVLDELGPLLGSSSRKVTASLLSKRIAFLTTAACLYPMSAYNRGLDLSLANCVIDYSHDSKLWTSKMLLHSLTPSLLNKINREEGRAKLCRQLFCDNLSPMWQAFREASGVTLPILWENTAVRVYSLYERRLAKIENAIVAQQVKDDFDYLINKANQGIFGCNISPLQKFYYNKIPTSGGEIRYRKTCCYYYATAAKEYCSNCPLPLQPRKKNA